MNDTQPKTSDGRGVLPEMAYSKECQPWVSLPFQLDDRRFRAGLIRVTKSLKEFGRRITQK